MNSSRYVKLGVFVLAGVALLFMGIVSLGAASFFKKSIAAETYVDEPVGGLGAGSVVRYRGVPVGKVKQIRLAAGKYPTVREREDRWTRKILIELALDDDILPGFDEAELRRAVASGMRAKLSQSMITGDGSISVDFFDPKKYPVPEVPWQPGSVYIPSVPSTESVLVNSVERLMNQLQEVDVAGVVRHLDDLLGNANRSIDDLKLAEFRREGLALLSEVRGSNARVKQLLDDPALERTVHDLPEITGRLQSTVARVNQILNDKRLDQTLSGLTDAATNAGPATADARQLLRDARVLVASEQENLRSIIGDLTTTAANLRAASEDARNNPGRLLFEQPPRRRKPGE